MESQLGDDRFGRIPCPWPDSLAGAIGAADGDRVERLIDYAAKKGIVERDAQRDLLGLSPEGWNLIERPKENDELKRDMSNIDTPGDIVKAHCNDCGGERKAYRYAYHTSEGQEGEVSWSKTYDILECCGCGGLLVRYKTWFSSWDKVELDPSTGQARLIRGVKVTYLPPPDEAQEAGVGGESE